MPAVPITGSGGGGTSSVTVNANAQNQVAFTDRSINSLVTGNVAQNITAINSTRHYLFILNPASASEAMWFSITGTAAASAEGAGSMVLNPGQSYLWSGSAIPTNALSVIAVTQAHKITCTEG